MRVRPCLALFALLPVLPVRAAVGRPVGDKLGTIRFEVAGDATVRNHVVRGVKLLHHMTYDAADREFVAALAADPNCAFAYWGRAMANIHPLWMDVPDAAALERGLELVDAGLARAVTATRERAYLSAMDAYFRDAANRTLLARLQATDAAWSAVAKQFPNDLDAAAFGALFHLAPVRFLPKDKSNRVQLQSAAIVSDILAQIPDHPGALHYKIHAFDFPALADRALDVCDSYGSVAPDVAHALHMPTHIFTRRGLWEKSIAYNERAMAAAGEQRYEQLHALDYLVYASLQRGQYRKVEGIAREVAAWPGPFPAANR